MTLSALRSTEHAETKARQCLDRDHEVAHQQRLLDFRNAQDAIRQRDLDRLLDAELDDFQVADCLSALRDGERDARAALAEEYAGGHAGITDAFRREWQTVHMLDQLRAEHARRLQQLERARAEARDEIARTEGSEWWALQYGHAAWLQSVLALRVMAVAQDEGAARQWVASEEADARRGFAARATGALAEVKAVAEARGLASLESAEMRARWVVESAERTELRGYVREVAALRTTMEEGVVRLRVLEGQAEAWGWLLEHAERERLRASERHLRAVERRAAVAKGLVELQEHEGALRRAIAEEAGVRPTQLAANLEAALERERSYAQVS